MRTIAALAAVAGLAFAGCGGSGTKTVTVAKTNTTTTQTTLTEDPFCENGKDTQNGSPCTPQSTDTTTTDSTPSNVVHADVGKTVKLDSLSAKIENVSIQHSFSSDTGTSTAKGKYVQVTLRVTNRANAPQEFDSTGDQTTLVLANNKSYTEDFDAENGNDQGSCVWKSSDGGGLQPDQSTVCNVDFDIPAHAVASFSHLGILNFGDDVQSYDNTQQLGAIELGTLA